MKKQYSRLGLPDLLLERPSSTNTEQPTVIEEIVVEEIVVEDVSENSYTETKSTKWTEVVASEPEVIESEPEVVTVEQSTEVIAED